MINKKLLWVFMFLISLTGVFAQEIGINLIEYHPDTEYTRLQITNNAGQDLNDVVITIGGSFTVESEGVLKDGAIFNAALSIPSGEHTVIVTTREGITRSKLVFFSQSKKEFIQERRELIEEKEKAIKKQDALKELAQKNLEATQQQAIEQGGKIETGGNGLLIGGIIVVILSIST